MRRPQAHTSMKTGIATVIKHTGSHYLLSELPGWEPFPCVLKGKMRLKGSSSTNPVAVGDRVRYETEGETGSIIEVLPRKNYLIRKSTNLSRQTHVIAANIDKAFLVTTLIFPEVKLPFLDRILLTCEVYNVPVTIVLNKSDLYRGLCDESVEAFKRIYHDSAGYDIMEISALTGEGVEELREECRDKVVNGNVTATAYAGIVRTKDLENWERLPNLVTLRSAQQRNVVLHPEFVKGKYAFYTRPMDDFIEAGSGAGIGFGVCDDIMHPVIDEEIIINHRRFHTINEMKNGA